MKGQHSMLSDGITLPRLYFLIVAKDADAAITKGISLV